MAKSKHSKQDLADSPVPGALSDAMTNFALSLIDHGLTAAAMHRILTNAFLQAAAKRARLKNGRVNQSRVAIMTGLTRTEVRKHFEHGDVIDPSTAEFGANRVVNSWMRDPEFLTSDGQPKELPLTGRYGSFKSLARLYSGDIPARATLEELKRLGVVRVTRSTVRLLRQSASGKRRQEKTLSAIGMQISDSLRAIGYPNNSAPTHVTTDSITLEAGDLIAVQLLRQRCLVAAKGMLAGLEVSSRNLPHEMKSSTRVAPGKIKVSVIISEST